MRITSLKIKNFLSLADVEIKPGKITQIAGGNNQGKTSILKALEFAVLGSNDPSLVKLGEDQAEVLVELSDTTSIRRRLNSEGRQSVEVKREGMKAQAPQAFLGALFDQSSFNPLDLLDPKGRTETILKCLDIKLTPEKLAEELHMTIDELPLVDWEQHGLKVIDAVHRYMYQRRAEANKVLAEKTKRYQTYRDDLPEAPKPPDLSREELMAKREECQKNITSAESSISHIKGQLAKEDEKRERVRRCEEEIQQIEKTIAAAQARKEVAEKFLAQAKSELCDAFESDEHYRKEVEINRQEIQKIELALKDWQSFEALESQRKMVHDMEKEVKEAQKLSVELDRRVTELHSPIPQRIMSSAEMPVKGLDYVDGDFYVDGVRVDNLSTSAAMKLAIALARKLAKKTRIICIDGAEQLDEENYDAFCQEIKDDGFTYFITKVGAPFNSISSLEDQKLIMKEGSVI